MKVLIAFAAVICMGGLLAFAPFDRLKALYGTVTLRAQLLKDGVSIERDVMLEMPDGVRLATDIYLPKVPEGGLPALLIRLPYGKDDFVGALWWVRSYTSKGYAVVVQDLRGRYGSEGVYAPYRNVTTDGAATLNWIAAKPWSSGAVATSGCSALGEVQLMQAKSRNPHLRALIAEGAGGAIGTGGPSHAYAGLFEGGIPNLAAAYGWFSATGGKSSDRMHAARVDPAQVIDELPSGTLVSRHRDDRTDYEDFLAKFEDSDYWRSLGYLTADDRFAAPALHVNSWHDIAIRGTFEAAELMRANAVNDAARRHQHVLVGPGLHCNFSAPFLEGTVGDLPVSKDAGLDYIAIYDAWLDHWLRDGPEPDLAQYTYFVNGADQWQEAETWPPSGTQELRWHLGVGGTLGPEVADAGQASFRYDPMHPTPSIGGPICCTGGLELRQGPLDQSPNAGRSDVLAFSSEPLDAPLTLVGDIRAEIAFSSDAPGTDLVAVLLDISPTGTMLAIQQGALRLRYRDGFDRPHPLTPGKIVHVGVDFPPIAYRVAVGHRLGLHLSSASFPRLERNMNGLGPNHLSDTPQIATNKVYFGEFGGSSLLLPVTAGDRYEPTRAARTSR